MTEIRSDTELRNLLGNILEDTIEKVSDKVLEMLIEYINKYVYGSNPKPNEIYYNGTRKPTYEFREAFRWDEMKKGLIEISRMLFYDPSKMRHDADTYLHGSKVGGDSRANLADILNVSGFTSSWNWKKSEPYWDNFIDDLFKGELDKMFTEAFKYYGIIRS